jgi:RepB DNA-primase from phage plasmid
VTGLTAEQIPQDAALRLQLAAITGNEPASSYIEVRPLRPDGRPAPRHRAFIPVRHAEEIGRRVHELAPTHNVFIGAAPRVHEAGTAQAVERIQTLWADLDDAAALSRLRAFRPLPAIVVRTGSGGAHAYWPQKAPLEPQTAQRANRRLALALGADRAATDPARILRPIGSFNHKHAPAREVICTRLELHTFTLREVVGGLPDDPAYAPRRAPRPRESAGPGALAGLARVVREAPVGERNRRLNWAAFRAGEHGVDAAEVERELLAAALDTGLPEQESLRTIASGLRAHEKTAA